MKIDLNIVRDSHNTYVQDKLELSGGTSLERGDPKLVIIKLSGSERSVSVYHSDLVKALRALE